MREFIEITKALSDTNRVRIILALNGKELCVCQIIALLLLAPSTVSKHMSILKSARMVESTKKGRWVYYRLPRDDEASEQVLNAIDWVINSVGKSKKGKEDKKQVKQICRCDVTELFKKQSK